MNLSGLVLLLLAGLAIALAAAIWHTARTLRRPPRRSYAWALSKNAAADPSELRTPEFPDGFAFEAWTLRSRGVDLPVWDIPGRRPGGPVVIYSHGWRDSRITSLPRLPALAEVSSRIILWDMPAHGDAPGVCTLGVGEVEDLLALVERVAGNGAGDGAAPPPPIVLYGFSLGAGVSIAAAAAATTPIAGVIAEAPYRIPIVPARNVMRAAGLPWRIPLPAAMAVLGLRAGHGLQWATDRYGTRFDRAALAAKVRAPLLVIHGDRDASCPIDDGRAIAAAAPSGSIVEIPGAGHNDLWTDPAHAARVGAAVAGFLARFGSPSPSPAPTPAASLADK